MQIIEAIEEMRRTSDFFRRRGKVISFVPTMGYFHEGHLSLMREAKTRGDFVVASIYVNPTQFGAGEDFDKYPRDIERDITLAEGVGVDVIFSPSTQEMYPKHYQTYVNVEEATKNLCGASRPGHFKGVATICAKLFNIVKPYVAVFGKKDFQQYVVIKRMVQDLNMNIEIVGMQTVREASGLAMSSRNVYLKTSEMESALSLSRSLKMAKKLYDQGQRIAGNIISAIEEFISKHPYIEVDYIKICDTQTLEDVTFLEREAVLALAVRVGSTRLIDNYVFGEELPVPA